MAPKPTDPEDPRLSRAIDRLLSNLNDAHPPEPDTGIGAPSGVSARPGQTPRAASTPIGPRITVPNSPTRITKTIASGRAKASTLPNPPWTIWARVGLALLLAASLVFWPYANACGFPLFGFLAAVTVASVSGIWSSVHSWRARISVAHVLALAAVAWSAVLMTREVLPRTGYAQAAATWGCVAPAVAAEPVVTTTEFLYVY